MNRTRELLRRPAGGIEPKKESRSNSSHHGASSFSSNGNRSSGNEEGQKWRQKLTDNKLFKRLLQPAHVGTDRNNSSSSSGSDANRDTAVIPRLGEVPARSKYFRPEQQNSHFATTVDYLPLAEICGPPAKQAQQVHSSSNNSSNANSPSHDRQHKREHHRRHSDGSATQHKHHSHSRKHRKRHRNRHHNRHRRHSNDGNGGKGGDSAYDGLDGYGTPAEDGDDLNDEEAEHSTSQGEDNDEEDGTDVDATDEAAAQDGDFGFNDDLNDSNSRYRDSAPQQTNKEESCLRENLVRSIPGSVQRRQYGSTGSTTSATSSIGPTGLALLPQFRWVPRPGGGGHGFNPFMVFRRQQVPQQQPHAQYYMPDHHNAPTTPATRPTQAAASRRVDSEATSTSPLQQDEGKMTATLSTVGARNSSYGMFYETPSPAPQHEITPLRYNSFYGPIGTLGIEASRKRRQLELENGAEGDAEKAYKARTSRRSSRFDDGSILLITKVWCDPDLLLSARVIDSPRLSDLDDEEDDSSSDGSAANIMDWDTGSDDAAAGGGDGKPPACDEAMMAAREARARKERIRQEKRRYQPAESPSFYFAGDELVGLQSSLPTESPYQKVTPVTPAGGGEPRATVAKAVTAAAASSSPDCERLLQTKVKPSKAVQNDDEDEAASSSSRSSDNNNSSDDENNDDSNSDSDSDSPSDNSSNSNTEYDTVYVDSEGGRSPRNDDSITRVPANGRQQQQRQQQRSRNSGSNNGPPPDVSISVGTGAVMVRSVTGDPGQYDLMNSSMIDGPGGSLFFPHYDNEASVVATALQGPLTPFHRPRNVLTPMHGANSGNDRPCGSAVHAAPMKSVTNSITTPLISLPAGGGHDKDPLSERPVSGNGAAAASALREMKRVKKTVTDTRANAETSQGGGPSIQQQQQQTKQARQQQSVHNASAVTDDVNMGNMSAYGSSFHLHDGRPLYSPPEDPDLGNAPYGSTLPDKHIMTNLLQSTSALKPPNNSNSNTNTTASATTVATATTNARSSSTTSSADYVMSARDIPATSGTSAARGPSESPVGFSMSNARGASATMAINRSIPSRNPTIPLSLYNNNERRTSTTSHASISMGTGGYNSHPSGLAPCLPPPRGAYAVAAGNRPMSLTLQPLLDGRRFSQGASPTSARGSLTHSNTSAMASSNAGNQHKTGNRVPYCVGEGYYEPITPPGTPCVTTPMNSLRENGGALPVVRTAANMGVTPGLGESTHFNDHGYELPGMS